MAESTHAARLSSLSLVCKWWREAIDSSPQLWTDIHWVDRMPAGLVERILIKSADSPLNIKFVQNERPVSSDSNPEAESFLELLIPHSRRWQSLYIWTRFSTAMMDLLQHPAPLLSSLTLFSSELLLNKTSSLGSPTPICDSLSSVGYPSAGSRPSSPSSAS